MFDGMSVITAIKSVECICLWPIPPVKCR